MDFTTSWMKGEEDASSNSVKILICKNNKRQKKITELAPMVLVICTITFTAYLRRRTLQRLMLNAHLQSVRFKEDRQSIGRNG